MRMLGLVMPAPIMLSSCSPHAPCPHAYAAGCMQDNGPRRLLAHVDSDHSTILDSFFWFFLLILLFRYSYIRHQTAYRLPLFVSKQ